MNTKNVDVKLIGIIVAIVLAVIVFFLLLANGPKNKAIRLEESIDSAKANITVVEKKRNDLVKNLVACVKEYDKHEYETLMAVIEARGNNETISDSSMSEINQIISVVAEAYPELKSNTQYTELMTSIELNENQVAQYRMDYNRLIRDYNSHCRAFPHNIALSMTGYDIQEYSKLSYDVEDTIDVETLFD